jgi:GT2 family glycosyltransferase
LFYGVGSDVISIILNSYSPLKSQRHSDIACIADIRRFTDAEIEIIIIDNDQTHRFRDDYGVLAPYTLVENPENRNVYASYNQGASYAKGKKLMFIQNDVFVHERCIDKLAVYLDEWDIAFPQQIELTREQVKHLYDTPDGEMTEFGWRDAGLLAITKEAFDKSGGWDDRFSNLLGEAAYYDRIQKANLTWTDRTNAIVTHIKAGTNLSKDSALYNEQMEHDAKLLKELK